ncbi:Signal peptide peptidase-like 3 [Heterocephalus glaber]|uniref:Signal peptide peptidase-like 3 n=1 Tax=Heterocephalus glaber TaxID=10181 RepID=G5AWX4_HETGA|nr:Signal peptide peptidase-like 3 [Heterocephalus glaber]
MIAHIYGLSYVESDDLHLCRRLCAPSRAYSLVDSSQVSTFLISILLIVYGSFRSLNMDFENQDKEKDSNSSSGSFNGNSTNNSIQTIDSTQALFLPIGASVSLLVMFFFFDSVQVVFTICTAVLATIAFAFLLLPMCQYLTRPCSPQNKISFGCCGRFTAAELLSFSLSVMLVLIWVLTGHWLLMDALAMGLCVAMIAFVRLPSLKVSCLLLSGLLIYDVFWVFFSAYIFNSNVMVKVATQPADNPLDVLSRKLHLGPNVGRDVPRLSLPGKLVFPSSTGSHFSMLGIGDIVMPGLLLCFVLRYDNYKKQASGDSCGASGPANISGRMQKVSYFHCTLIGYFVGLLTATVASRIHRAAQPALLYLVPFTLLPLLTMAYLKTPSSSTGSHFSMLGIGDIVMPGLLLCFVLRYDNYKKQASGDSCGASGPANISGRMQKVSYFHCTLIGYFVGLLTATVASRIHRAAQPALLYLVPFTLLPLLTMAYLKGDLRRMWSEPFHSKSSSSRFLEV